MPSQKAHLRAVKTNFLGLCFTFPLAEVAHSILSRPGREIGYCTNFSGGLPVRTQHNPSSTFTYKLERTRTMPSART